MKKVILGSLVAMMAVSAANAEIASVEYVAGKTGDIAQLTTTANSNLTAAVNELNTGVKAAATKTELTEGLATKQATITDLADIRSGATAGATALQQAAIVNAAVADADQAKLVAPSYAFTSFLIDEANSSVADLSDQLVDLEGTVADNKTAADEGIQDAKDAAANALTDAKAYADGLAGNYDAAGAAGDALAAAKTYADGVAATAKSEAIAASDSKGSAAAAETAAKTYADGVAATAKSEAIAASDSKGSAAQALTDAKAYADGLATNYDAAGSADDALAAAKTYADGAAATAKSEAIAASDSKGSAAAAETAAKTYADSVAATAKSEAIAASDSKGSAAQALADAKTYADGKDAETLASAKTYAEEKASAAQTAAEAKVTELANGAVKTNTEAIAAINDEENGVLAQAKADAAATYQVKSSDDYVVGMKNGEWKSITDYYAGLPAYCSTGTCSLVSKDGAISWEKVAY